MVRNCSGHNRLYSFSYFTKSIILTMTKTYSFTETILDDAGMQLLVSYTARIDRREESVEDTTITSVEVVIGGKGVEIVKQLDKKQLEAIEEVLEYQMDQAHN